MSQSRVYNQFVNASGGGGGGGAAGYFEIAGGSPLTGTYDGNVRVKGDVTTLGSNVVVNGDLIVDGALNNDTAFTLTVNGNCLVGTTMNFVNSSGAIGDVSIKKDLFVAGYNANLIPYSRTFSSVSTGSTATSLNIRATGGSLGHFRDQQVLVSHIITITSGLNAGQVRPVLTVTSSAVTCAALPNVPEASGFTMNITGTIGSSIAFRGTTSAPVFTVSGSMWCQGFYGRPVDSAVSAHGSTLNINGDLTNLSNVVPTVYGEIIDVGGSWNEGAGAGFISGNGGAINIKGDCNGFSLLSMGGNSNSPTGGGGNGGAITINTFGGETTAASFAAKNSILSLGGYQWFNNPSIVSGFGHVGSGGTITIKGALYAQSVSSSAGVLSAYLGTDTINTGSAGTISMQGFTQATAYAQGGVVSAQGQTVAFSVVVGSGGFVRCLSYMCGGIVTSGQNHSFTTQGLPWNYGAAGSVTLSSSATCNITANGGSNYNGTASANTGGNGGAISVSGDLIGVAQSQGLGTNSLSAGHLNNGGNGGSITIQGNHLGIANSSGGSGAVAGTAGNITINGNQANGNVIANGGNVYSTLSSSPATNGGTISITGNFIEGSATHSISSLGGTSIGTGGGGNGGTVTVYGTVNCVSINTSGGFCSGGGSGRNGGNITIEGHLIASSGIVANGGVCTNGTGTAVGGGGGNLTVTGNFHSNSVVDVFTATGGNCGSVGTGNAGFGGGLTIGGDLITQNNNAAFINVNGGSQTSTGSGAAVTNNGVNIKGTVYTSGNSATINTQGGSLNVGATGTTSGSGGSITVRSSDGGLSVNASGGTNNSVNGTTAGAGASVTISALIGRGTFTTNGGSITNGTGNAGNAGNLNISGNPFLCTFVCTGGNALSGNGGNGGSVFMQVSSIYFGGSTVINANGGNSSGAGSGGSGGPVTITGRISADQQNNLMQSNGGNSASGTAGAGGIFTLSGGASHCSISSLDGSGTASVAIVTHVLTGDFYFGSVNIADRSGVQMRIRNGTSIMFESMGPNTKVYNASSVAFDMRPYIGYAAVIMHNGFVNPIGQVRTITFFKTGVLAVGINLSTQQFSGPSTRILNSYFRVETAPVGSNLIMNVNYNNGAGTVYTTAKPTILSGQNEGSLNTVADSYDFGAVRLNINIEQVGSGTPGSDLTFNLRVLERFNA